MSSGMNEYVQYGTALASAAVIAAAISCITQLTGAQTAIRGIKTGAAVWVSFVLTTWGTEYIFEVKPVSLLGVDAGFWLVGMMLMGATVGGWKRQGTGSRE